jgi:hypothetical protein
MSTADHQSLLEHDDAGRAHCRPLALSFLLYTSLGMLVLPAVICAVRQLIEAWTQ